MTLDSSIVWMLGLQAALIALNAVFACAEIAVISMNDAKLAAMVAQGDKRAVRLARLTSQPARFLATIQVAITLSGFMGSAFAADNFSDTLVSWLVSIGVAIPEKTLDTLAVMAITVILSYFTLVFGELVPKRVAMRKAETLALGISGLIHVISKLFAPIVWLLTASTNGVLRLMRIDPNEQDDEVSEEEIRMMVDVGSQKGTIDRDEKRYIQNVFEFDDLTAGEIVTHRTELTLLWLEESMDAWNSTIHESRHTLYPVCADSPDQIVGILNAKDYFRLQDKSREAVMEGAVKPAYFVPESVKADVLFRNMKRSRNAMAVVLDEYGGMTGIITINDLVEQLVGDLGVDEPNTSDEPSIEPVDGKTWKVSGSVSLEALSAATGFTPSSTEYDTLSGLVFGTLGAVPPDGETLQIETAGLSVNVLEIRDHQIEKALVCLTDPPAAAEQAEGKQ